MAQRTRKRLDTIAFVVAVVAIACFLFWFFATTPM
jgi:cytochrome c-type biogenesis protein CcmE